MSFVRELRLAAVRCLDTEKRTQLTWIANKIESDIRLLSVDPTEVNLRALNGSWAYAHRKLALEPWTMKE